jgi:hypothetical protein
MSQADIETLEVQMDQAKAIIKLNNDLSSLFNDSRFKEIIVQGYFNDEAVRLCALKSDIEFQSDDRQMTLDRQIWGLGSLNAYFLRIGRAASMAQQSIDADANTHSELLDEAI